MERAIVGNSATKALLDIALHDALARTLDIPVATLLGGKRLGMPFPTRVSVAFTTPGEAAKKARSAIRGGYRLIKVRVGLGLEKDEGRLTAIREVIDSEPAGSEVTLVADANGAWQPKEAIGYLRRWERYRLGWIEQPVGTEMIDGLRLVRRIYLFRLWRMNPRKGPGRSCDSVEEGAVDMLHFKLIKAGGFFPLRAMEAIAEGSRDSLHDRSDGRGNAGDSSSRARRYFFAGAMVRSSLLQGRKISALPRVGDKKWRDDCAEGGRTRCGGGGGSTPLCACGHVRSLRLRKQ